MRYVTDDLVGPVTDLLWHEGQLFISHRGRISILDDDDQVRDLVTGLPSQGDHHNNQLAAGPDGMIYFGQGTATNSGVVGIDNFLYQWLAGSPDVHDRLPYNMTVHNRSYTTINPFIMAGGQGAWLAHTKPLAPFAQDPSGERMGVRLANGTVMRMKPDGSSLEVYAWGLRNPFGLAFARDGQLYATNNGFDERGSRPIANDTDQLYAIEQGAWYGWPDFAGGMPVTDERFQSAMGPRPQFVLREHPPVEKPVLHFPPHSGVAKLATNTNGRFGDANHLYVAVFGPMTPMTGTDDQTLPEPAVLRIDPRTRSVEPFFTNIDSQRTWNMAEATRRADVMPLSFSAGIRRPVDVAFSPDGTTLYVVDIGALAVRPTRVPTPDPRPGTGVIWRIVRSDSDPVGPPGGLSVLLGARQVQPAAAPDSAVEETSPLPGAFPVSDD
jgi:glucose/arabinose dehydrogenase